jgi:hypothetical protein
MRHMFAAFVLTLALLAVPAQAQTVTTYFTFAGQSNQYLVNYCLVITVVDGVHFPYGAGAWCPNQDTQFTYPAFDDGSLYLTAGDNSPLTLESIEITKGAVVPMSYYPNGTIENFQRTDSFVADGWTGSVQTSYHNVIRYCGGGRGGNVHRCDYLTTIGGTGTITR